MESNGSLPEASIFKAYVLPVSAPVIASEASGVAVPMPTLLLLESTFRVVVSTVKSPLTAKLPSVPTEVILVWAAVDKVPVRVVADTVVSPLTVDGNPMVTVPLDSETSTSFEVTENVAVPPNEIAVVLEPSLIVIVELDSLLLAIEPANIPFSTACAAIVTATALLIVTSHDTATGL